MSRFGRPTWAAAASPDAGRPGAPASPARSSSVATIRAPSASSMAATSPPTTSQPTMARTRSPIAAAISIETPWKTTVIRVGASRLPSPTGEGRTTIGRATSSRPPRSRKAASARGQVAGRARVTSSAPRAPLPRSRSGAGRRLGKRRPELGCEDLELLERRLDQLDLRRRRSRSRRRAGPPGRARSARSRTRSGPARRVGSSTSGRRARRRRSDRASASARASATGPGAAAAFGRQEQPQRLAERLGPDDVARRGDHDPLELRERRPGRLEVDRLEVDERVAERDDDQVAPDDLAAGLVPQRDLLADRSGPGRSGPRSGPGPKTVVSAGNR